MINAQNWTVGVGAYVDVRSQPKWMKDYPDEKPMTGYWKSSSEDCSSNIDLLPVQLHSVNHSRNAVMVHDVARSASSREKAVQTRPYRTK